MWYARSSTCSECCGKERLRLRGSPARSGGGGEERRRGCAHDMGGVRWGDCAAQGKEQGGPTSGSQMNLRID